MVHNHNADNAFVLWDSWNYYAPKF